MKLSDIKRQSLKVSLKWACSSIIKNIIQIISVKKINLKVIKPAAQQGFGDKLTFYTFIFKCRAVRYEDVPAHIGERAWVCYTHTNTHTHTRTVSLCTTLTKFVFFKVMIWTNVDTGSRRLTCIKWYQLNVIIVLNRRNVVLQSAISCSVK